jgi:hypothetical protein
MLYDVVRVNRHFGTFGWLYPHTNRGWVRRVIAADVRDTALNGY